MSLSPFGDTSLLVHQCRSVNGARESASVPRGFTRKLGDPSGFTIRATLAGVGERAS